MTMLGPNLTGLRGTKITSSISYTLVIDDGGFIPHVVSYLFLF
jgi:hypothetical protein